MEQKKTHYRKAFKSDHLGSADLEEMIEEKRSLVFTIKEVRQEVGIKVAGVKGTYNIAYFVENIKPLVVNIINSKILRSFCNNSPFVQDWKNIRVELYINENVKMGSEIVSGVRIKPYQPIEKIEIPEEIKKMVREADTIEKIKELHKYSSQYRDLPQLLINRKLELDAKQ